MYYIMYTWSILIFLIGNERQAARESLAELRSDGISVHTVVTDPDSATYRGAMDLHQAGITEVEPVIQVDTVHVNRNQRKYVRAASFTAGAFPGCETMAKRRKVQNRLANDLTRRCHGEHAAAFQALDGDTAKVRHQLNSTIDALLLCYQGNHSSCSRVSYLCHGSANNNWFSRNMYLGKYFRLCLAGTDRDTMLGCIRYRLGPGKYDQLKFLSNSQKCEAVNRAISASSPKQVTFSRNHTGRVHSAIRRVNSGIGEAMHQQMSYIGQHLEGNTRATRALLRLQLEETMWKERHTTKSARQQRYLRRQRLYNRYDQMEGERHYRTGMLLENTEAPGTDHSYCK